MVRKKQFINKKTAQHFHVVHRSQRDPMANDPEASKYVLLSSTKNVEYDSGAADDDDDDDEYDEDDSDDEMPDLIAPPSAPKATARPKKSAFPTRKVRFGDVEVEDMIDENGMARDGYDYSQHFKEMGKGKFYSADGQFNSQSEMSRRVDLPDDVLPSVDEQERLLDAITLTTETMDDDLREALVNDTAFEEIDDDFVVQAAAEDPTSEADGFDYDAHIAKLMAAASGVPKYRGNLTDDEEDDEEDDEFDEFDSEDGDEGDAEKDDEKKLLDAMFDKMMAEEYDDDMLGELEEDDPETRGELVLEGELLDEIVEDFVNVRQEILNDEGKLGNPLRTGNRLKEILAECEAERLAELGEDGEEEDTFPEEDPAETERKLQEMFSRNAYLQVREEDKWDCETIVSTYSNMDNHPTILREELSLKKKNKKKKAIASINTETLEAAMANKTQIVLSRKTGMPIGVLESKKAEMAEQAQKSNKENEVIAIVSSAPKKKSAESKEEKKARKEAAKLLKKERREDKKQWKNAYKDEEQRQNAQAIRTQSAGKVSIFKY
ncbi:TPA: hypothetical protein N0F65_005079 [Lagenidium giganteum]|uniref:Uncharacterized protein n=1 Tax=Lagenidium giganteum TaxID=4803 RepID=A0AAV2YGH1_9STRA|nr:TPA: hypothetical protein N0F65_005079 [Lagenidium giganteum]